MGGAEGVGSEVIALLVQQVIALSVGPESGRRTRFPRKLTFYTIILFIVRYMRPVFLHRLSDFNCMHKTGV